MHMPDGILPLSNSLVYLSISSIIVLIAIWQSKKSLTLKQIPIVGVLTETTADLAFALMLSLLKE